MNGSLKKKKKRRDFPARMVSTSKKMKGEDPDVLVQFIQQNSSDSESDVEHYIKGRNNKRESDEKACSGLEKIMTGLLVVALLIVVALSILLVVHGFMYNTKPVCESSECVQLSGSILKNMDLSVEPCNNFYQYACGGFEDDPLIPPDEAKYSWFSYMDRRSKALLKRILDTNVTMYMGVNSSSVAKAKLHYKVCMNETATENMGVEPLFNLIKDVGSWTVTSGVSGTWDESKFNIEISLSKLHSYGMIGLFSFGIGMDDKNTSVNRFQFDQAGLTFSDYTNYVGNNTEKYHKAFVQYFTSLAVLLGGDSVKSAKAAEDVWQFEKSLAEIQDTPEQRVDVKAMYNKITLSELQNIIGGDVINLAEYLSYMFGGTTIAASEKVLVYAKNYFSKLGVLLKKTSKETLANYISFKVVQSASPYLPQRYQAPRRQLRTLLVGVSAEAPLWLMCATRTESTLGSVVGALYVDQYFTEEDKLKVEELLQKIVEHFEDNLPRVTWMDEKTRKNAQEKITALKHKIGYPDYIKDPKKLDKRYELLNVTATTMFDNFIQALQFAVQDNLMQRGKAPDPTKWSMAPTEINAYYSPLWNQMVFPAAILEKPFYSSSYPMAMNYGSMGFIMGHELTHGFDNTGRNFDKSGNMDNWWTDESAKHFEDKTTCLVNQYSAYKVGKGHVNGLTTLGENIADNGGLKNSYRAYHSWLKLHGYKEKATNLPGLNMTENQLFFLSFAQTWCAYYTPQYAQRSLVTDVHSYAKYRVIGALSNIPEFSEAFQCSPGSPMNPDLKCTVW